MRIGLLPVLFLVIGVGADVLFQDDFEDGYADGWTELPSSGVDYEVLDGWYRVSGSFPEQVLGASLNGDQGGSMSTADYSILVHVEETEGDFGLLARFSPFTYTGYVAYLNPVYDIAVLARLDGPSSEPEPLGVMYYDTQPGVPYWLRFEISGSLAGVRIWTGSVGDEPGDWLLTAVDATWQQAGAVGLYAVDSQSGGTAEIDTRFDDVTVTDDVTLELDSVTWASLKAGPAGSR